MAIPIKRITVVALTLIVFAKPAMSKDHLSPLEYAQQNLAVKGNTWTDCLRGSRERFLASSESAEAIATSIMSVCSGYEEAVRLAFIPIFGLISPYDSLQQSLPYAQDAASNKLANLRQNFRDQFISIVVERRMQACAAQPDRAILPCSK